MTSATHIRRLRSGSRLIHSALSACRAFSAGRVKRLPIESITNEFAFSFAREGWNYFRAAVAEYTHDPDIAVEESAFCRFFQDERIRSVRYLNDLLFFHDDRRRSRQQYQFYLGTYPWSDHVGGGPWGHHFDHVSGRPTRDLYGHHKNIWYEPGDIGPIRFEWNKTVQLYESLKAGYAPLRHGQFPEVTLLVRRNGQMRAIRYNGQHRLAILSHLNHQHVVVIVPSARDISADLRDWPTASPLPKVVHEREVVVHEDDVNEWYYVKQGYCTAAQALDIFDAFFDLTGRERLEYLGLAGGY